MVIYKVAKGTPYKLVVLNRPGEYWNIVGIEDRVTQHDNHYSVDDIVIDPIFLANEPTRFANYDPRLVALAQRGYVIAGSEASGNYLLAVRYEDAIAWG